jgi:hypothetical protein
VKLTVPSDLAGSSILGVHNWIKSQVARSNPGGSPDYTIVDMSGNKLTLSDVARNPGNEILVNVVGSPVKSNPPAYLAPVPGLELEYPMIPRSGNDVMLLMPEDIDPTLVQRIVAEQGLNRGLHTLNRLLLMQDTTKGVSPQTAAILQMGEKLRTSAAYVRKNPADRTPFTQRTPHYYSPEKALGEWMTDYTGATNIGPLHGDQNFQVLAADAKVANKYGLSYSKLRTFSRSVLAEFLFAASANRGLLRALTRNSPEVRNDRELMQRLIALFPQRADQFYEGQVNVFVATPLFIYPAHADGLLSSRQMNSIIRFARGYPQNMNRNARMPASISKLLYDPGRGGQFTAWLRQSLSSRIGLDTQQSNDLSSMLDQMIESGGLTGVVRRFDDPEGDRQGYLRPFSPTRNRPIGYFSNIGGMYPTIPAKWPPALVYAIMDGFLEHLGDIVDTNGNFGFQAMRMGGTFRTSEEYQLTFPNPLLNVRNPLTDTTMDATQGSPGNETVTITMPRDLDLLLSAPVNEAASGNITWDTIRSIGEHPGFDLASKGAISILANQRTAAGNLRQPGNNWVRAAVLAAIEEANRNQIEAGAVLQGNIEFAATEGVSVLELCYRIAEIATEKYNYNPRGDDFLFIMAMCEFSLRELQPQVQVGQGPREPQFVRELPGIVDVNMNVPLEFVEAELELGLAEAERQGAGLQDLLQGFRDAGVNEAEARRFLEEQGVNLPEGQAVRMNPNPFTSIANRIAKSYNQKKLTKRMSEQADRRIVQALKDSLSPEAAAFLKAHSGTKITLRAGQFSADNFNNSCEQLINAYQVAIENGCEAIRENINGVVVEQGNYINFAAEKLQPILQSIDAAGISITHARWGFIRSLNELREYGGVLRGVAGTIPGLPEAIDRALFLDARNSELLVDSTDSRAAMATALDAISAKPEEIKGETVKTLYSGFIAHIGFLNEMYEALQLLLESRGSEDRRAEYHLEGAVKYLIGALEADLRAIDPEGNAALIERLDQQAAELNNLGALLDGLVV